MLPVAEVALPIFAGAGLDGHSGALWALAAAAAARFVFQACRRFTSGWLAIRTQHSLRMAMARGVLDSPTSYGQGTGQVVSRSIADLNQIYTTFVMLPLMAGAALELVLLTVVVWWMSPPIAAVITGHIPLLLAVAYASRRALYDPS
ncbi:MAG TPA: ABC transporter ATP-binding protein, partial [Candidatus Corynebacterium gallistercoris]|nr:ABC transporter ATP-binding protein [Candidatus Corynebacterium gallistercoris]